MASEDVQAPPEWKRAFQFVEETVGGRVVEARRQPRWRPAWFLTLTLASGGTARIYLRGARPEAAGGVDQLRHEYRCLRLLEERGIPVPRIHAFCTEPEAIVMDQAPGRVNLATAGSDEEPATWIFAELWNAGAFTGGEDPPMSAAYSPLLGHGFLELHGKPDAENDPKLTLARTIAALRGAGDVELEPGAVRRAVKGARREEAAAKPDGKHGTVGCVALDREGNLTSECGVRLQGVGIATSMARGDVAPPPNVQVPAVTNAPSLRPRSRSATYSAQGMVAATAQDANESARSIQVGTKNPLDHRVA